MASPRTRRVLQDLRPINENSVSESLFAFYLISCDLQIDDVDGDIFA